MKKLSKAAILIASIWLLSSLTGCVGPKIVAAASGAGDQIKFIYAQDGKQGVVKCDMKADGGLTNCREMQVILTEGGEEVQDE